MSNLIGQTLLNQYRVDSFIASGGMGAVYRVTDLKDNCVLAMKVLNTDLTDDTATFKRFQREANALQKLRHPNIVTFHGVFQEEGIACLLEEYIPGASLQEILRKRNGQPVPVEETLAYMKGLCAALHYAHTNGVIHCDVKPGNVLINLQGKIFLADFGIAKFTNTTTTTTIGIAGTPAYMAPEQIVGRNVTPQTDIYALGVVLFEMLTGQRPFRGTETGSEAGGNTPAERIRFAHLRLPPPDPRQINPDLSPELSQMLLRGLTKNPAERFQSVQDFFLALCQAAKMQPNQVADEITLIGKPSSISSTSVPSSATSTPRVKTHPPAKRAKFSPFMLFSIATLSILFMGILIAGNSIVIRKLSADNLTQSTTKNMNLLGFTATIPSLSAIATPSPTLISPPVFTMTALLTATHIPYTSTTLSPTSPPSTQSVIDTSIPVLTSTLKVYDFSDEFDETDIQSDWKWIDPGNDATYNLINGWLNWTTPGDHNDLYAGSNLDAPRLLHSTTGDFTATTKVDFAPNHTGYQGAGILVWVNQYNYIRLEHCFGGSGSGGNGIRLDRNANGNYAAISSAGENPTTASMIYLRMTRSKNIFYVSYSFNDKTWNDFSSTTLDAPENILIGLILVSQENVNAAVAKFDYFRITR